jgi:hypothetical protein
MQVTYTKELAAGLVCAMGHLSGDVARDVHAKIVAALPEGRKIVTEDVCKAAEAAGHPVAAWGLLSVLAAAHNGGLTDG